MQSVNASCNAVEAVDDDSTLITPPASDRYLPEGHTLQVTDPVKSWNVPRTQLVQLAAAEAAWKLPAMQLKQSAKAMCTVIAIVVVPPPASFRYLPAAQLKQRPKALCAFVEAVAEAKMPLALVLSVKYVPDGHTLQLPEPVASW